MPVNFDMPSNQTVNKIGKKVILGKTTMNEKRFTVVKFLQESWFMSIRMAEQIGND